MIERAFSIRRTGTIGLEIISPHGEVIAWTTSEVVGALLCHLLNGFEQDGNFNLTGERKIMKSIDEVNLELLQAAYCWKEEDAC